MEQTLSYDEKYQKIIHLTCTEVNRVLKSWRDNNVLTTQIDINCLFKSYFSKYCKHILGWKVYHNFTRYTTPIPLVKNDVLIGIHLSDCPEVFNDFKTALIMFRYSDPTLLPKDTPTVNYNLDNLDNLIDYNKLETFKY